MVTQSPSQAWEIPATQLPSQLGKAWEDFGHLCVISMPYKIPSGKILGNSQFPFPVPPYKGGTWERWGDVEQEKETPIGHLTGYAAPT
jgi:hypothetical protein